MQNLIDNLEAIVGRSHVLSSPDELLVYECDGLPHHKHRPLAVVFPASTGETSAVMKELARAKTPFTPRGAGTGLSGGALALNSGVVIEMARMRKILSIDPVNRLAVVQPGVVNLHVSRAAAPFGLYYVPDPSSQPTCTIGGNIAESAGGIHCLKYGTTTDHVLGCKVVLAGGDVVEIGGAGIEKEGYDLLGIFIGSEGTFGIVTEATLKLVDSPPAIRTLLAEFGEVNDASHAVSAIIAAGVMPAALEMMDREIIRAIEASVFAAGLPPDAGAALLIELDGIEAGLDDEADHVTSICMEYGARNCRRARDEAERKKLWAARKGAFGAIGRISPDSMIQDAVVPRSRLPEVLGAAYEIAARHQLRIANVFHAGDGNLHPLICFDSRFPEQVTRVKEAGRELMEVCVGAGGTITGEHGVGLDKRELLPLVFSETDMNAMLSVRTAFDPLGLCNPGKIIPMLRGCGESNAIATSNGTSGNTEPSIQEPLPALKPAVATTTTFTTDLAPLLEAIVGKENVNNSGLQSLIISPASTIEVSEVLRLASSKGWTVRPEGGGSNQRTTPATNLIVSTTRLSQVIEHEPADLIAIAQAGVTLRDFNLTLETNGQWLPLDPPNNGAATLAGVVATGIGGCQQFGYGRPRGSVIGMEVVLADGSVINVGGRVVKNVAGYDLCKLFTGSFGTLGIITKLNFKLRPRPQHEITVVAAGRADALVNLGRSIVDARLFPVAVELISSALANQVGIETDANSTILLVRFAGNEKSVQYQVAAALDLLTNEAAVRETATISDDAQLWDTLARQPVQEQKGWRASVLPSRLSEVITQVNRIKASSFLLQAWQLSIGTGHIRLMGIDENEEQLRAVVRAAGGNFFSNSNHSDMGSLARRIKAQLDPNNTLPMSA